MPANRKTFLLYALLTRSAYNAPRFRAYTVNIIQVENPEIAPGFFYECFLECGAGNYIRISGNCVSGLLACFCIFVVLKERGILG